MSENLTEESKKALVTGGSGFIGSKKEEVGKMALIINYDSEADVLVLKVKEDALVNEELLDNDVVLGYDRNGKIVSVEILDASRKGLLNAFLELAKSNKDAAKLLFSKIG